MRFAQGSLVDENGDEDRTVGEIKFYLKKWETTKYAGIVFQELKSRRCTEEDFMVQSGSDSSEYGFYQPDQTIESAYDSKEFLKCIDEPFEFYGNYDTYKGSNLLIVFELCDSNKTMLEEGQQCLE